MVFTVAENFSILFSAVYDYENLEFIDRLEIYNPSVKSSDIRVNFRHLIITPLHIFNERVAVGVRFNAENLS
jgi:hypothetical protein